MNKKKNQYGIKKKISRLSKHIRVQLLLCHLNFLNINKLSGKYNRTKKNQ